MDNVGKYITFELFEKLPSFIWMSTDEVVYEMEKTHELMVYSRETKKRLQEDFEENLKRCEEDFNRCKRCVADRKKRNEL